MGPTTSRLQNRGGAHGAELAAPPNKSLNRTRYSGLFFRGWRIVTTEKPAVTARLTRRYVSW